MFLINWSPKNLSDSLKAHNELVIELDPEFRVMPFSLALALALIHAYISLFP